ncbi:unnamed protein product [Mycena citricolor]|uniref:AB hydrolase-1 domain-containing protein n=1 Tax=Mycena citricolor TaxID=2018698 RepID=A0AAD2K3K0_9AGAR|nr:unnamed protein product [Mycena citricolor]
MRSREVMISGSAILSLILAVRNHKWRVFVAHPIKDKMGGLIQSSAALPPVETKSHAHTHPENACELCASLCVFTKRVARSTMRVRATRFLTYLLLLVPPLIVSLYLLTSFPTPPSRRPAVHPGLSSLAVDTRARRIYTEDWLEEGGWADLPLGRTRYWFVGPKNGKKLVLIHGLSVPALIWSPFLPHLLSAAPRHRILLYDLYGRGYSDAPRGIDYDTQLYVTQLALLLQHVGWTKTRIAGISMGGAIAAAFVDMFPALVERDVVLIAAAGILQSSDLSRTSKFMSSPLVQTLAANPLIYSYLRRLAAQRTADWDGIESQDPSSSRRPPVSALDPAPIHALVRLQSAHLAGFNWAVSSSLRSGPVVGLEWAYQSPEWAGKRVLLVHGTADDTVPAAHATRIREHIETASATRKPQVQVIHIEGATHSLTWTHAPEVGRAVGRFLSSSW